MNSRTQEKQHTALFVWFGSFCRWFSKDYWRIILGGLGELAFFSAIPIFVYWSIINTGWCRMVWSVLSVICAYGIWREYSYFTFCHLCQNIPSNRMRYIRKAEEFRKYFVRPLFYIAIILLVINTLWLKRGLSMWIVERFTLPGATGSVSAIKATGLIILSFALFFISCETISRRTFRKWPVYFLSAAVTLLFLVFMDIPYKDSNLTWGIIDTTQLQDVLNQLPGKLSGSILAAIAVSFIFFLVRDRWTKHQKKLAEDMVKETRRQLLSHWGFRPIYPLSNDNLSRMILVFVSICLVAGVIVFTNITNKSESPGTDEQMTSEVSDIETNGHVTDSITTVKQKSVGRADDPKQDNAHISIENNMSINVEESKEDSPLSFTGYMFILAVVLVAIGLATHFDISNKSLIESEYYYLLYHSLDAFWDPTWKEPFNGARELRRADYFQVMSYLYSNGSAIKSEEYEWHKLGAVLTKLYKDSDAVGKSGKGAFLSRMLYSYAEIKEQISLNQGVKEEDVDLSGRLRSEQIVPVPEMMFSKEIIAQLKEAKLQLGWNYTEKNSSAEAKKAQNIPDSEQNTIDEIERKTAESDISGLFEQMKNTAIHSIFLQRAMSLHHQIAKRTLRLHQIKEALLRIDELHRSISAEEREIFSLTIDEVDKWKDELLCIVKRAEESA